MELSAVLTRNTYFVVAYELNIITFHVHYWLRRKHYDYSYPGLACFIQACSNPSLLALNPTTGSK